MTSLTPLPSWHVTNPPIMASQILLYYDVTDAVTMMSLTIYYDVINPLYYDVTKPSTTVTNSFAMTPLTMTSLICHVTNPLYYDVANLCHVTNSLYYDVTNLCHVTNPLYYDVTNLCHVTNSLYYDDTNPMTSLILSL